MRRGLGHLRPPDRPVIPQVVQLLRTQRTARIRVLDRLSLLLEARPCRRRHGTVVELLLRSLIYARRRRAGPRKLFGPANPVRLALTTLDRHWLLPGLSGLRSESNSARIGRGSWPVLRLVAGSGRRTVRVRGLARLLLTWLACVYRAILIRRLVRLRLRLRYRCRGVLLRVCVALRCLIRLAGVRNVPVFDLIDLV